MKRQSDSLIISKCISKWLNVSLKEKSVNTVNTYDHTINLYTDFLQDVKKITPTNFYADNCFSVNYISDWLDWLESDRSGNKCSPQSCNVRLSALRNFLKFLGNQDVKYKHLYLDANEIPLRKTYKKPVEGFSQEAFDTLINEPDDKTVAGYRDKVLMALLYRTAIRINEALSLTIADIHLNDKYPHITITGKGRKIRSPYLKEDIAEYLRLYINKFFGEAPDATSYVFFSRTKGKNFKLSQEAVRKRLKMYCTTAHQKCSDVPLNLHAHQFRHARASNWIKEGLNVYQVQKLLGHEHLETTSRYIDVGLDMISEAINKSMSDKVKNVGRNFTPQDLASLFKRIRK